MKQNMTWESLPGFTGCKSVSIAICYIFWAIFGHFLASANVVHMIEYIGHMHQVKFKQGV